MFRPNAAPQRRGIGSLIVAFGGGLFIGLTFVAWYYLRFAVPENLATPLTIGLAILWSLIIQFNAGCRGCATVVIGTIPGFVVLFFLVLVQGDPEADPELETQLNLQLSSTVLAVNVALAALRRFRKGRRR